MKYFLLVLASALFSSLSFADLGGDAPEIMEKTSTSAIERPAVVSDDGALRMSIVSHPDGAIAAIVVVDQVSEATFVFPIDGSSLRKSVRSGPGLQSEGEGGGIPDGATLEFMGCAGSVCTYGVFLGDAYLGTLIVDYSGPQPKATFQPPQ
jgi:hypothetical protein